MGTPRTSAESGIVQLLAKHNQRHLIRHLGSVDRVIRKTLLEQLSTVDLDSFFHSVREGPKNANTVATIDSISGLDPVIAPLDRSMVHRLSDRTTEADKASFLRGLEKIATGKVAACVLAGGQGSRMGLAMDESKGMLEIASNTFVFEIFVKRLARLRVLAIEQLCVNVPAIPFLIMTSPLNHNKTLEFLARHENFGYDAISVFTQGTLPAVSLTGELLLESPESLVLAPDGNGGIYRALAESGNLRKLQSAGVEILHVFSVDNILSRVLDPVVIGNFNADVANKVVWKREAREKVGVFGVKNGKVSVIEYSDLVNPELNVYHPVVDAVDETGSLVLGAGNICSHFYSLKFLDQVIPKLQRSLHLAVKKIPHYDLNSEAFVGTPEVNNGVKLEAFIFDAFEEAGTVQLFEVDRIEEFCPMKNLTGEDSLESGNKLWLASQEAAAKTGKLWSQIYPGEQCLL